MRYKSIAFSRSLIAMMIICGFLPKNAMAINPVNEITIRNDKGGNVARYVIKARKFRKEQKRIRFAGRCESACTLLLAHPNHLICLTKSAKFGFHLPHSGLQQDNYKVSVEMMRTYPNWVSQWIRRTGGLKKTIHTMNYSYAKNYLQTCS